MNNKLSLTDKINVGKKQRILVSDIVSKKGELFKYIKRGYEFDDEVLEKAGVKKTIRNKRVINVVIDRDINESNKTYPKETESLRSVLKSLCTIDNQSYNKNIDENSYEEKKVYSIDTINEDDEE